MRLCDKHWAHPHTHALSDPSSSSFMRWTLQPTTLLSHLPEYSCAGHVHFAVLPDWGYLSRAPVDHALLTCRVDILPAVLFFCHQQGYMTGAPSFGPMGLMGMAGSQGGPYSDDGGAAGLGHGYNDSELELQASIFSAGTYTYSLSPPKLLGLCLCMTQHLVLKSFLIQL